MRKAMLAILMAASLALAGTANIHSSVITEDTLWAEACAAVSSEYRVQTCQNHSMPEIHTNSILLVELIGAMGLSLFDYNHIYLAPSWFIQANGNEVYMILYHEMLHFVIHNDAPMDHCAGEAAVRALTDKRYGLETLDAGWEAIYGCD